MGQTLLNQVRSEPQTVPQTIHDLQGLTVKVVRADEDEIIIELPNGKRLKIYPDIACAFWDGDICVDAMWSLLLDVGVVEDDH